MSWYYLSNGKPTGPIPLAELQKLHLENVVQNESLVWTEGMAEWARFDLSQARAGDLLNPPIATDRVTHTCVECKRIFPEDELLNYENLWVCAACKPLFFQRVQEGAVVTGMAYATWIKRVGAYILDTIITSICFGYGPQFLVTGHIAGFGTQSQAAADLVPVLIVSGFSFIAQIAYWVFFNGRYGATPGKMVLGIKIVGSMGERLTYWGALGRMFAEVLSGLICYIGFLMPLWDKEKRALHDMICNTRVIEKS